MLQHMGTYEYTDGDGVTWLRPTGEWEDDPCVICGGESVPNVCPGDGRLHHHGKVHTADNGFVALCDNCIIAIDMEWTLRRAERNSE